MSITYNFQINITKRKENSLSSTDIIESLIEAGWSLFSENNLIIYTDVGDDDGFNFLSKPMNKREYYDIVNKKQRNKETIALALFRSENNCRYRIDVIITITSVFEVLISPDDATRKMLSNDLKILDVNWYISRIIPYLTNEKMLVENFSFSQY